MHAPDAELCLTIIFSSVCSLKTSNEAQIKNSNLIFWVFMAVSCGLMFDSHQPTDAKVSQAESL